MKATFALAAAFLPGVVVAGQFTVNPVRIFMATKDRTTSVTVVNEGTSDLVMQADLYAWRQTASGQDELIPTDDLIAAPPILKLAPGAKQVVRMAMLKPMSATEQLTYRVIIREIPEVKPPEPGVQLQIALAFSLPIFITPPGAKHQLVCDVQRAAPNVAQAVCENKGTAYTQATQFKFIDANGKTLLSSDSGGYILPGAKRSFELKSATSRFANGKAQLLVVQDDQSVLTFDAMLAE